MRVPGPWGVAAVQARMAEILVAKMLGRTPPLNRDQLLMLREDNVGDPGPMIRDYGLGPADFRAGLRRACLKPES